VSAKVSARDVTMSLWRTIRQVPEFVLLLTGFLVIPWLPRRAVLALASGLGSLAFCLGARLRSVGRANLDVVFGNSATDSDKEMWLRASFGSFALVILDLFWFAFRTRARSDRWIRWDDSMSVFSKPPVIGVTAHFGNWEALGFVLLRLGGSCLAVAAPLMNPLADWFLNLMRRGSGERTTRKQGSLRPLFRELRNGRNVALVVDQNVVPRDGGVFIDVFGVPALVSPSPAQLSARTGAPVVAMFCIPDGTGHYGAYATEPVRVGSENEVMDATRQIELLLEKEIRKHPGCWLWMYKRWHYRAEGTSVAGYPYYTRVLPPAKMGDRAGVHEEGELA